MNSINISLIILSIQPRKSTAGCLKYLEMLRTKAEVSLSWPWTRQCVRFRIITRAILYMINCIYVYTMKCVLYTQYAIFCCIFMVKELKQVSKSQCDLRLNFYTLTIYYIYVYVYMCASRSCECLVLLSSTVCQYFASCCRCLFRRVFWCFRLFCFSISICSLVSNCNRTLIKWVSTIDSAA